MEFHKLNITLLVNNFSTTKHSLMPSCKRFTLLFLILLYTGTTFHSTAWGLSSMAFSPSLTATEGQIPPQSPENPVKKIKKPIKRRNRRLSEFKRQQGTELLRASAQMGLGIGIIGGLGYLIGGKAAISAATFMGPLISGMLVKPLGNIGTQLCILFTPGLADPGIRKALDFKKRYEVRKPKLPESMNEFLRTNIDRYTNFIQNWNYQDKAAERAIEEILAFPIHSRPIDPPLESITELLKNYPEEVRVNVSDFVSSIIIDSKMVKLSQKSVPLMFIGVPGSGKTYLAHQLGKCLDIPVEIIDVTKYQDINGSFFMSENVERGLMVDMLLAGKTEKGNFSNKILVLDEIDKALEKNNMGQFIHPAGGSLLSFLHTLLETQETTIRLSRYGGASYDISQIKIILIGNRTFREVLGETQAQALETRVNLVKFRGFEDEQKRILAQAHIDKMVAIYGLDYTKVDQQIIEDIIKKDSQAGNKGIRVMLKIINQYLRRIQREVMISKMAGVSTLTFDLDKTYEITAPAPIVQDTTASTALNEPAKK